MLTLPEFLALLPPDQLNHVWERALLLATRPEGGQAVVKLYQVDGFFVEIQYASLDEFCLLDAFTDTGRLLRYLDELDINCLLNS
jgi:hypothetical protein